MNASEKKRRAIIYGGMIGIVFLAIIFIVLSVFNKNDSQLNSNISNVTDKRVQGSVASDKASAEYNQMIEKHDNAKANEALETGESYFSIPTSQKPAPENPSPPPKPPKQNEQTTMVKNEVPPQKPAPKANFSQEEIKKMTEAISMLDEKLNGQIGSGEIIFIAPIESQEIEQTMPTQSDVQTSAFTSGTMLYAIVDTAINSDVSSAVMATVISGDYRKTKFIGSFARFDKRLVIKFERAVLPDGSEQQIEAYAVDPSTSEASVADKVNTHFFSRWGGLIAASFLEGLGEAKQYSGAETVSNVLGEATGGMVFSEYSVADQAWIAAGKVGERASEIFAQNFNRPPTVHLNMGSAIGILILNTGK